MVHGHGQVMEAYSNPVARWFLMSLTSSFDVLVCKTESSLVFLIDNMLRSHYVVCIFLFYMHSDTCLFSNCMCLARDVVLYEQFSMVFPVFECGCLVPSV